MTDTGAVIRAIKMGFAESVICDTLHITKATFDIIKEDYNTLRSHFDKGLKYDDTAALLMKDAAEVWYVYHVFESDNKTLEQEILAENDNNLKHRRPPSAVKQKGAAQAGERGKDEGGSGGKPDKPSAEGEGDDEESPKPDKKGVSKDKIKKAPKKDKIGEALTEEGEAPAGAVLMEDAGKIAKELSETRQAIGKYVMETMDLAARYMGYTNHIDFLEFIYNHFLDNYGKAEQKDKLIRELMEANNILIDALSERNRRAFIARQVDSHVFQTMERGYPVATDNLLAYAEFLERYYMSVNTESLLDREGEGEGVEINGKITQ